MPKMILDVAALLENAVATLEDASVVASVFIGFLAEKFYNFNLILWNSVKFEFHIFSNYAVL